MQRPRRNGSNPADAFRDADRDSDDATRACSHRDPEDDFFCLRFQVWYPSRDCAIRTKFRTCPGCFDCEQGRFNLKRHGASLRTVRQASALGD